MVPDGRLSVGSIAEDGFADEAVAVCAATGVALAVASPALAGPVGKVAGCAYKLGSNGRFWAISISNAADKPRSVLVNATAAAIPAARTTVEIGGVNTANKGESSTASVIDSATSQNSI